MAEYTNGKGLTNLVWVLAVLFLLFSGCTTVQTFPDKARAGDTITLAVGSADGMNRSNTTIAYTSDADPFNPVDLTPGIRAITKIYPDRTSNSWLFDSYLLGNIPEYSSHGPWEMLVVLDLPTTMPVGTGTIQVTTGAVYPTTADSVNSIPISMEILNGLGAPNPFNYRVTGTTDFPGNLSAIEPLPQFVVRQPVGASAPTTYGAIEITVAAPMTTSGGQPVPNSDVRVVVDDMGPRNLISQLQSSWVRNGDQFTVYFISPNGLMKYYESRFSIVLKPGNVAGSLGPSLISATYYDINGSTTTGPVPTITFE
ncbi:MAG TPA: hypothetical protein ENI68_08960 [Gammaproteobacteria bacterium]|nr:hypothetical protein [Gammaproteobacteria bacterium]